MMTCGVANHAHLVGFATNRLPIQTISFAAKYALRLITQCVESYLNNIGNLQINLHLYVWIVWNAMFATLLWRKFNTIFMKKRPYAPLAYATITVDAAKSATLALTTMIWSHAQYPIAKIYHIRNATLPCLRLATRQSLPISFVRFAEVERDEN